MNRNSKCAGVIVPLLGALGITLSAAAPSLAQSEACAVTFQVTTSAAPLKALQFSVDSTAAAPGGFDKASCTLAAAANANGTLADYGSGTNSLSVAWANNSTAFTAPGDFVTCNFVATPATLPSGTVVGDFSVTVEDASSAPGVPVSPLPTVVASSVTCVPAPPSCGNGVVELGETCDGDADCTASCALKGSCSDAPLTGCFGAAGGKLQLKNDQKNLGSNGKDQAQFQAKKGDAVQLSDLGDPINGTAVAGRCTQTSPKYCTAGNVDALCATNADCDITVYPTYSLCVYDGNGLVQGVAVGSGPSNPGWAASGTKGYKFKGASSEGISQVQLKTGDAGKSQAKIVGKDKAGAYGSPSLPLTGAVTGQLVITPGANQARKCFTVDFPVATKNEAKQYNAKK